MAARVSRGENSTGQIGEQWRGQIAFAERAHDRHDTLPFPFGTHGELGSGPDIRAAADPCHDPFLPMEFASPFEGEFIVDLDDFIDQARIEIFGYEPCANTLDAMLAGLSAADHRRLLGLDGDRFEVRVQFLDVAGDTGDGPSGSDPRDDRIDLSTRIGPDFRAGGPFVDGRVGGVFELLGHPAMRIGSDEFVGFRDRAAHPFGGGGQHEVGSHRSQKSSAFDGHRFGHREGQLVPFCGAHKGEGDPCISARGFDDVRIFGKSAALLGILDHCHADAVFDAFERVEELAFGENRGAAVRHETIDTNHRCIADRFHRIRERSTVGHSVANSLFRESFTFQDQQCSDFYRFRPPWQASKASLRVAATAGGSAACQTQPLTAIRCNPASRTRGRFSGVMPPMAKAGGEPGQC